MTKNYIYAYSEPHTEKGIIKIGQTKNKNIEEYLNKTIQARNSSKHKKYELLYSTEAKYNDKNEYFTDHTVHNLLKKKGYDYLTDEKTGKKTEEYNIEIPKLINLITKIKERKKANEIDIDRFQDFKARPEQKDAVEKTKEYFKNKKTASFLWNAKMRFGKTFAAYKLMKEQDYKRVLILTYKPAVHKQWQSDLENHVDFKEYRFFSARTDDLKLFSEKTVCFMSYQDMIGKTKDNKVKEKHTEIYNTEWDLVIIDEFHYGSSTKKAQDIFKKTSDVDLIIQKNAEIEKLKLEELDPKEEDLKIKEIVEEFKARKSLSKLKVKYKLYLSGTPFKALQNNIFSNEAIFNWTYVNEQKAKEEWQGDNNPYESLPQIKLFVYQLSESLIEWMNSKNKSENEVSLNSFFKATKKGNSAFFGTVKENTDNNIKIWLDDISGLNNKKDLSFDEQYENQKEEIGANFPYDIKSPFKDKINHTLWFMPNVASALAMEEQLKQHIIFKHYKINVVVGGRSKSGADALPPVEEAIKNNKQTITLSCGMLTTGVSIPQWSAVLFLRDIKSPESYFQTAFRCQTPYLDNDGKILKKTAYIFDFSPNRSLELLIEYSEKLSEKKEGDVTKDKIEDFIKYLPILKFLGNRMVALNAADVLTFNYNGIDTIGLGKEFSSSKNIVMNDEILDLIMSDDGIIEIFNKIKKFSEFHGNRTETKNDNGKEDYSDNKKNKDKIEKDKAQKEMDGKDTTEEDKKLLKLEKETDRQKKRLKELVKTILARIPLFMYLTNASEENLKEVLAETERDLFKQATGLKSEEFLKLVELGAIKIDTMDGYILKYREFENSNYKDINSTILK